MKTNSENMNTAATVTASVSHPADCNMSGTPELDCLINNYNRMVSSKSIYYPVAYRFGSELGRGHQGIVFKAYRHGARGCMTRHAIKLFDPSIYPSCEKYWIDMGRVAAQISHLQGFDSPNLIRRDIYEEVNGIGYVQMNVIEGLDVQQLIYGTHFKKVQSSCSLEDWSSFTDIIFRFEDNVVRIQPGVAVYIVRSALRGLEVLHNAGYLHSDIKPANLMVDRLGLVKLVDYGRAVQVDEQLSFLLGTPLYMAPETHMQKKSGVQSDIYSLGLVLLEMLTGSPLVNPSDMTEDDLLEYKMKLPEILPELVPPYVKEDDEFMAVLVRLLDPDSSKRFGSAGKAESLAEGGLARLHQKLTLVHSDSQYDRDMERYISILFPSSRTNTQEHQQMLA